MSPQAEDNTSNLKISPLSQDEVILDDLSNHLLYIIYHIRYTTGIAVILAQMASLRAWDR